MEKNEKGLMRHCEWIPLPCLRVHWPFLLLDLWFQKQKREKGAESLFNEIMRENFFNLGEKQTSRIREFQITEIKRDPHWDTIKLSKVEDKES